MLLIIGAIILLALLAALAITLSLYAETAAAAMALERRLDAALRMLQERETMSTREVDSLMHPDQWG